MARTHEYTRSAPRRKSHGASASICPSTRSSSAPPGWKFGSRNICVTLAAA